MGGMARLTTIRRWAVEKLRRPDHWTSGLNRYAGAHALASGADALVAVSLAGSLFFSISPDASRDQVLLYLVINMVPFTLLAPLIGPTIDHFRGSHRVIVAMLFAIRAVLAVALAFTLFDLALYFFALALLIAGKASGVTRQALVPGLVDSPEFLVSANSRLARISLVAGSIAGGGGAALLAATSPRVTLAVACGGFVAAAALSTRLAATSTIPDDDLTPQFEYTQMHTPLVASTAWAFTVIRAAVGFFAFGIAFALRRENEPAFMYGAAAAAYAVGTFAGNLWAPAFGRRTSEDRLAAAAFGSLAIVASFGALGPSRPLVLVVAAVLGSAAAIGRQGFDALVQTRTPLTSRGSAFARFETRFQLGWVAGAIAATAIRVPVRASMAIVASGMVPAAIFYLRNVVETRRALAGDPFDPLVIATRRIESLNTIERRDHPTVAVIELGSVADIATASGYPVADELIGRIEMMRRGVLAGIEPDPDDLNSAIDQMALTVAGFSDSLRPWPDGTSAKHPGRRSLLDWRRFKRRATPGTSP